MLFHRNQVFHTQPKRHPRRPLKREQGVVIIMALFIVALVAAMAYVMMARLARDTMRTQLIVRTTQAEFYAQGSLAWAMEQLRNNWEKQRPNQIIDVTPIQSPLSEVNGYRISSTIYDAQSRFNLNNLTNIEAQADFKRLLHLLLPDLPESKVEGIALALLEWISPAVQQNEKYYLDLPTPYREAHRLMMSASESLLVKGMTPEIYRAIQPYIIALPVITPLNVQSASAPLLAMLSPTMNLGTAKVLIAVRSQSPFLSTEHFLNLDIIKNHPLSPEKITITSSYFLVKTEVEIENQQVVLYTLLERASKAKKALVTIVWQSKGTY